MDVSEDSLKPHYRVLAGEHAGTLFTGFRLNYTKKGIRRMTKILRAWDIYPQPDSTLESIADQLVGKRALAAVTEEAYKTAMFNDVSVKRVIA